ncbi:lysosomal Pro-X carboxypeptidase-like [Tropilaelaps mercedesae]|uniref:Lysosomal Pro-X carboxypeptidase-like n=1 Tax=Tropilaelaps mercedesae TaxID=418985 RepID=A0A1V9X2F3_9ACAR|nr:lysosomal Pro-X carboxypeptidase-like [Tropilaelaps mercedesae]
MESLASRRRSSPWPTLSLLLLLTSLGGLILLDGVHTRRFQTMTTFFNVRVDHFGYSNNHTFPLRVLYNNEYFDHSKPGPIFVYTGNEGDIAPFVYNTGLLWDWAKEFGALLVFIEHRYYGKSQPYGRDSLKNLTYFGYLTVQQALADFAQVVSEIKRTWPGVENSKVVAFGGSYAGMLAAWLRMKYPWLVDAALTSGAPIRLYQGLVKCNAFNDAVAKAFLAEGGKQCVDNIRRSWAAFNRLQNSRAGVDFIFRKFHVCLKNVREGLSQVRDWIYGSYVNLAMHNYPYGFDVRRVASYPVRLACAFLQTNFSTDEELLSGIYDAVNVYHNDSGKVKCNDVKYVYGDYIGNAWQVQSCNELVMPYCANGKTDLSYPFDWDSEVLTEYCQRRYGMTPDPEKFRTMFGGDKITMASNIVFSNGDLDPWSIGGFTKSLGPSLPAVIVRGGAHLYDLRGDHPKDTNEVKRARNLEREYIKKWIGA